MGAGDLMILGMPWPMFLVFAATILAGSIGAIHYVIVHIILRRPFGDEGRAQVHRDPGSRAATGNRRGGAPSERGGGDG